MKLFFVSLLTIGSLSVFAQKDTRDYAQEYRDFYKKKHDHLINDLHAHIEIVKDQYPSDTTYVWSDTIACKAEVYTYVNQDSTVYNVKVVDGFVIYRREWLDHCTCIPNWKWVKNLNADRLTEMKSIKTRDINDK